MEWEKINTIVVEGFEVENMREIENYPEHIEPKINMNEPNEEIQICEGAFILKNDILEIEIKGKVIYKWFPEKGDEFIGDLTSNIRGFRKINALDYYQFIYNNLIIGEVFISKSVSVNSNQVCLKGIFTKNLLLGNKQINVDEVFFAIPNLKNIRGEFINFNNKKGISDTRLRLENNSYLLNIDKTLDFQNRLDKLQLNGGFLTLYSGVLKSKKDNISIEESKCFFEIFDLFITFFMGRRVSSIFHAGFLEGEKKWSEFSNKNIDTYKKPESWTLNYSTEGINELFNEFTALCEDENDNDFLRTVIHWYVEANNNSGYTEGSIIMAQTVLELLYNWLLIEKKQLITGNDAINISASNKIRLLLSEIKVDKNIPKTLNNLLELVNSNNDYKNCDAPEIIVQIRNAIIHSQLKKREKLSKITSQAKGEALKIYIWYIELSILYILKYKGKYSNRCSNELFPKNRETDVPWV